MIVYTIGDVISLTLVGILIVVLGGIFLVKIAMDICGHIQNIRKRRKTNDN